MQVEIKWPGGLQSIFSNCHGAWPARTCSAVVAGSCSPWHHAAVPLELGEGEQPGLSAAVVWEWGREGQAAILHLMSCSAPHRLDTSPPSNPSAPPSCSEIFLHYQRIVFSA